MNFSDYIFIVDIDGTLCPHKKTDENYSDLVPYPDICDKLRYYHQRGAKIILYTARGMKTYNEDIEQINIHVYPSLKAWIEKWKVPCDKLVCGKLYPGAKGFYIDDRAVRPDEFLTCSLEELEKRCKFN